jgi:SAM-dependent methyltransferase
MRHSNDPRSWLRNRSARPLFWTAWVKVYGIDRAPVALVSTQQRLQHAGLSAHLLQHDVFDGLPFGDVFFDANLSVQVILHARLAQIGALVEEITRVLRPNGLLFVSVPQLQNQGTQFQQIEPGTYIPPDGREAGLPHHYCLTAVKR